jgi:hypothetical protein
MGSEQWRGYLRSLAQHREQLLVGVSVTEAERDRRDAPRRLPLHAISYEADEIQVTVGLGWGAELRYLVPAPRSIEVQELGGETVLRVADATGVMTVFRLFDPAREHDALQPIGGAPMS